MSPRRTSTRAIGSHLAAATTKHALCLRTSSLNYNDELLSHPPVNVLGAERREGMIERRGAAVLSMHAEGG